MNFSKKQNKTINYFRGKPSIISLVSSLFLVLLLVSSCSTPPEGFEYDVTFSSPDTSAIFYTDTLNGAGESLGPETVEIIGEITGNQEIRSINFEIRNSSLERVYDETFEDVEGLFEYTIDTEFQTDIAGVYSIYVTITYNEGGGIFVKVWHSDSDSFEYRDLDDNGGGENNDN